MENHDLHGGCIIADSVGLGKTFEALAIIKYYELRNDRVLVLVPKRLRDNWTLYKANDRETRYDRLMRRIIKEGVKTRVLMLSATPVNYDIHWNPVRIIQRFGRIDLSGFLKDHAGRLESLPFGTFAVTTAQGSGESVIPPGVIFCLRVMGEAALKAIEPGYPLAPHYVVHVANDGVVRLPFTQAKQVLDRLKRLCIGRDLADAGACARFDKMTKDGKDLSAVQDLLAKVVASIVGKKEELAVLRAKAAKEKQLNRRVELNLEIKRLKAELARREEEL